MGKRPDEVWHAVKEADDQDELQPPGIAVSSAGKIMGKKLPDTADFVTTYALKVIQAELRET